MTYDGTGSGWCRLALYRPVVRNLPGTLVSRNDPEDDVHMTKTHPNTTTEFILVYRHRGLRTEQAVAFRTEAARQRFVTAAGRTVQVVASFER